MRVVNASYQILSPDLCDPNAASKIYRKLEYAGRTCYKSEDKITDDSAEKFVRNICKNGHEAMLEHESITVKFIVDRGVSHELVRHRLASFAQESTRYCNYSGDKFGNEITVIKPCFFRPVPEEVIPEGDTKFVKACKDASDETVKYVSWYNSCAIAECRYFALLDKGCTPQEARTVLPNSLKTEVVMTANIREWRHFLKLRAAGITGKPHPQMLEVAVPLLNELLEKLPVLFGDIQPMEE